MMVCPRPEPVTPYLTSLAQPPNQVYIDVESHEMVDVLDAKMLPAGTTIASMPTKQFSEKRGKLTPHSGSDSF